MARKVNSTDRFVDMVDSGQIALSGSRSELRMKKYFLVPCVIVLGCPAFAQDSNWEYSATLYGWFTGLSSTVETPAGDVATEADFSDIWDALDIAFMGAFEARHQRWSFIGDIFYSDLTSSNDTPGPVFNSAEAETELTLLSAYAAYRVIDTTDAALDIGGGLRWYDLDIDVGLTGGPLPGNRSFGDNWVDPVLAARLSVPLSDDWYAAGFVDVGGFGIGDASDLSWQVLASIGYRINETWSARFGYRYLDIEKSIDGTDVNLELYGPMIGITAHF